MLRKIGVALVLTAILLVALASLASASPRYTYVSGNAFTCTRTQPEYMINAGGAVLRVQANSYKFKVTKVYAPGYSGYSAPYITSGYNAYRNASLCNTRNFHGHYLSRAYALPVKLGKQGNPVGSVHDIISSNFVGDSGFDMWFTGTPAAHSYAMMVNGGSRTTEIMVWLQHKGLPTSHSGTVSVAGHRWDITTGLAANGHGRNAVRAGWNVVNFIAPNGSARDVTYRNLTLNSFISYAESHGWLNRNDYLMSVNQGFEITHGSAAVTGYQLTGLPH